MTRMSVTFDPVGGRIEYRRVAEPEWRYSERATEGITIFRDDAGEVAAVIVDLSLVDDAIDVETGRMVEELLGTDAVEAARRRRDGDVDVQFDRPGLPSPLVSAIALGTAPPTVVDVGMTAEAGGELHVRAEFTGDADSHWAVVVDIHRSRPVAAGRFATDPSGDRARVRIGLDPEPGRYRLDITRQPFDPPPPSTDPSSDPPPRPRIRPWLAAVATGAVGLVALAFAFGSEPEIDTTPTTAITSTTTAPTSTPTPLVDDLRAAGEFAAPADRVDLTRIGPATVSPGDRVTLELARTQVAPDTSWDPNVIDLDSAIASCERRVGLMNPIPEGSSFPVDVVWHFRWLSADDPTVAVDRQATIREQLGATALLECGDSWANESEMLLHAVRELAFVPQRFELPVPAVPPGRYELHVVRPSGRAWDTATPVEVIVGE